MRFKKKIFFFGIPASDFEESWVMYAEVSTQGKRAENLFIPQLPFRLGVVYVLDVYPIHFC